MAGKSKQALEQAEAKFTKKVRRAALGPGSEQVAIQDKIARLRALRLAKEAAEREAAENPVVK